MTVIRKRKIRYSLKLRRELFTSIPERACCRDAFLAGLLGKRRGAVVLVLRPFLRRNLEERLAPLLPDGASLTLSENQPVFEELDLYDFRRRVEESVKAHFHCCQAFFKAIFLRVGYIQNPRRGYHLEVALRDRWLARLFRTVVRRLKLPFHLTKRAIPRRTDANRESSRIHFYLKDRKGIARCLHHLELYDRALAFEDLIATRSLLSLVNRQVNCETANIQKQVNASEKQSDQIRRLLAYHDQEIWTPALRELAELRLQFPHDSYEALGQRLTPPLGKSAINHRLRRISDMYFRLIEPPVTEP